ncbi:MAG TPA: hypothetical protein VN613_06815, partial [Gemmatimonadaceae bacterium]|nr:hypothetical protein [Gemmatimonadaceae bacterium]
MRPLIAAEPMFLAPRPEVLSESTMVESAAAPRDDIAAFGPGAGGSGLAVERAFAAASSAVTNRSPAAGL